MDDPQVQLQMLEKALDKWQLLGRRAQLEAAMPALDALNRRRVAYAVLANLLAERELAIKPEALRQALHRWRARQADLPVQDTTMTPSITASAGADPGVGTPDRQTDSTRAPLTKAALQDLRKEPVDLDAIIKASRKLDAPG